MSNAPRAWTSIAGQSPTGAAASIIGQEALRTVYIDPALGRIAVDTSVTPPRVTITATTDVSTFADDIIAINDRLTLVEQGGRWAVPSITVGVAGPEDVALTLGYFHRLDLTAYAGSGTCTCTLPEVTADDIGRRVAAAEISGELIGPGNVEIEITTFGAQEIDQNRTLPIALAGTRPRIVFVAVAVTETTWGWITESWGSDP